tara:strand:- start:2475 stop:4073 length:1599 start_codon:yes stop_codon:yes gene_type:complete
MSFKEETILNQLEELLGKEFTIPEFAKSYQYDVQNFAEYFFELDKENKIDFILTSKGAIRLKHVLNKSINLENVDNNKFTFPKDIELYKLIIFSMGLEINLRMEFDKCMADDSLVEKLKKMDEDEILEFLKIRADFYKEENQAELDKVKEDREKIRLIEENKNKSESLTEAEKKKIGEAQKKYQTGKEAKVIKKAKNQRNKKKNIQEDLRTKHEKEKQINLLMYGIEETNQAREIRLKNEKDKEQQTVAYLKRIKARKEKASNYKVGQVLYGKVVKVIQFGVFVDIGEADGFINTSKIEGATLKKYAKKFSYGKEIKCEITNIDLKRGNIDLVPTSKNITNLGKYEVSDAPTKEDISNHIDEKEIQRVDSTIENIISYGGKDSLSFFIRLIKKNIKDNPHEWSLTLPKNKKNTIRLNNFGLEGSYINDKGIMIVVMHPDGKASVSIQYLINRFVSVKNRQGKYRKVPKAVPAFLSFEDIKGNKQALYSGYCNFFTHASNTGKNSWKSAHSKYAVEQLSKLHSEELSQPEYLN